MSKEKRKYADRKEYIKQAVVKHRRKLKQMAVDYKGGKCEKCGYNKCNDALEFHHPDPTQKDFSISNGGCSQAWDKIRIELDKCIMLCSNCHREAHANIQP
jgi:hypothetical protein